MNINEASELIKRYEAALRVVNAPYVARDRETQQRALDEAQHLEGLEDVYTVREVLLRALTAYDGDVCE